MVSDHGPSSRGAAGRPSAAPLPNGDTRVRPRFAPGGGPRLEAGRWSRAGSAWPGGPAEDGGAAPTRHSRLGRTEPAVHVPRRGDGPRRRSLPSPARAGHGHPAAPLVLVAWCGSFVQRVRLAPGRRLLVGRSRTATLRLPDSGVSRQHAIIGQDPGGTWLIDLESVNRVYLDLVAVPPALRRTLPVGALIEMAAWWLMIIPAEDPTGLAPDAADVRVPRCRAAARRGRAVGELRRLRAELEPRAWDAFLEHAVMPLHSRRPGAGRPRTATPAARASGAVPAVRDPDGDVHRLEMRFRAIMAREERPAILVRRPPIRRIIAQPEADS